MLVITLGDPYSVNIEVLSGLVPDIAKRAMGPVVVVGSRWQWAEQTKELGQQGQKGIGFKFISEPSQVGESGLYFADVGAEAEQKNAATLSPAARGAISVRALEWVGRIPAGKQRLAVVTGPIDKHASALAGFSHPGQTEFFESLWHSQAVMILAGPRLRVGLATNHLALREVASHIKADLIVEKARMLVRTLQTTYGIAKPRVAVLGVNPHASDQGLFGDEEATHLEPALARLRQEFAKNGVEIAGPLPADTAFYHAYHGRFDAVLAMYHDQGLGPLKTVHFDDAVNLSGGLPHFRASPDHGPARDLFLKRQASPKSFVAALDLACRYLGAPAS